MCPKISLKRQGRQLDHEHPVPFDEAVVLCQRSDQAQAAIKAEIGGLAVNGTNQHVASDIVRASADYGNGSTYTLKRLKRDAPELAARVAAGELSAHAAAIEAGFRRKKSSTFLMIAGDRAACGGDFA